MVETLKVDIKALFLEREECDAGTVQQLRNGLQQGAGQYRTLREAVEAMKHKLAQASGAAAQKWHLKLGIALYFLGRIREASEHLRHGETALACYYYGLSLASLGRWDEAVMAFERAQKAGYTASQVQLQIAGIYRRQGKVREARQLLDTMQTLASHSAEYHFQRGCLLIEEGDRLGAVAAFEKATQLDPYHQGALFQLGYLNDLFGNDEEAIRYYERSAAHMPVHLGSLLNLGILYEDTNRYDKAVQCYERILAVDPTNERARLFLRDAEASRIMVVDEEKIKSFDRFTQVLEIPVTDFELSVRSRNCLRKLNIKTLGDLTRVSEAQLLASKNFGETSLQEIRELMASKGLRIGQALEQGQQYNFGYTPEPALTEAEQAVLNKPIADLNLSLRARKCMNKLGITTVGELIQKTANELLEVKNFGVTSLEEVRKKLAQLGVKLRGD